MAILAPNRDRGPFEGCWQLQFGCEMAILAPNRDRGPLKPSGNYDLGVKSQFFSHFVAFQNSHMLF